MPTTRQDYRAAILGDAIDAWQPFASPVARSEEWFPDLDETARAELVASILTDLARASLIAVGRHPAEARRLRPLSPNDAQDAIEGHGWRLLVDTEIGYITTRPGAMEWESLELCWACDGYVHRIATREFDFEVEEVSGPVPICEDHTDPSLWPEGAAEWITDDLRSAFAQSLGGGNSGID